MAEQQTKETGSQDEAGAPPQVAGGDLAQMFAPLTDAIAAFFAADHPQHKQRVTGAWVLQGGLVVVIAINLFQGASTKSDQLVWRNWIGIPARVEAKVHDDLAKSETSLAENSLIVTSEEYEDFRSNNEPAAALIKAWSRVLQAEASLRLGLQNAMASNNQAGSSRKGGDRRVSRVGPVSEARDEFEKVLESGLAKPGSQLWARAQYGLAVATEVLCDGSKDRHDEAVAAYTKLEEAGPPYDQLARDRIDSLGSSSAQEFYKWFAFVDKKAVTPAVSPHGAGADAATDGETNLLQKVLGGDNSGGDDKTKKDSRSIPDALPGLVKPKPDAGTDKTSQKKSDKDLEKSPAPKSDKKSDKKSGQ